jgi:hypothetical protein
VQVSDAGQRILLAVEELGEVGQIVAVPANLRDRMKPGRVGVAVDEDEFAIVLPCRGATPLLQLDDDERRASGLRVTAGEYDVSSLRGGRQVVLDEDLDLVQSRLDQVLREDRQAAFPGPEFSWSSSSACVVAHLLGDPHGQGSVHRQLGESDGGMAKQRHG